MNTKYTILGAAILGVVVFSGSASAVDQSQGTLTVTGDVVSSISLTIESAGGTTGALGTNAATSALGNISKFGAVPTGFTQARGATDWTLSSTIGVKVVQANSASPTYILNAKLASVPATGIAWSVGGFAINGATDTAMTATAAYGSTASYAWGIVVADSVATATALNNTIQFTALAN